MLKRKPLSKPVLRRKEPLRSRRKSLSENSDSRRNREKFRSVRDKSNLILKLKRSCFWRRSWLRREKLRLKLRRIGD